MNESPRPPQPRPPQDPGFVRPRHAAADDFEQNPLSQVAERVSLKAAEGLDDEGRVREALRFVIADGYSVADAAKICGVSGAFLKEWRIKYLTLLNEDVAVAGQPLIDRGGVAANADLIRIPKAAQEMFAENWRRLMERTRATPATFHQSPVRLFLENSWLTSWLFTEGELDRGTAWGAAVAAAAMVLAGTFFIAGRFYRTGGEPAPSVESMEVKLRQAGETAIAFFTADTLDKKYALVRPRMRTRELMTEYYQNRALPIPDARLSLAQPVAGGIYMLALHSEAYGRPLLVNVMEFEGRMKVDWETCSLFQEVFFEELRKTRPLTPVPLAVRAERDNYYNYGFTEDKYTCYRLIYPNLELDLFGYTRKGSREDVTLDALAQPFTAGQRPVTAILEVRYPAADAVQNQVEIVKIAHESWIGE